MTCTTWGKAQVRTTQVVSAQTLPDDGAPGTPSWYLPSCDTASTTMQRDAEVPLGDAATLAWPGFVLDLARGELFDATGRPTGLRAQALKVLLVLGERAGQVVGKDELMQRVWGDLVVTEDSLVQAIGDIRRVLGDQALSLIHISEPTRPY